MPIAMQGFAHPREKPLAQEQWETMEKQCEEQWKQSDMQARAYVLCGGLVGWVEPSGLAFGKPKDRLRETHRFDRQLIDDGFPPAFAGVNPSYAIKKAKRVRSGGAADARMSLCTYCHAPLAPGTQAEFNLSPLFRGAPIELA